MLAATGHSKPLVRRTVPLWAGAMVVALGISTLVGWTFGIAFLKTVFPGLVSMKSNTAICFILTGASLLLQRYPDAARWRLVTARAAAALVIAAAFMTLLEYFFDVDLGIDQIFFRETSLEAGTSFPGRMSPASAVDFVLLGAALLSLDLVCERSGRCPSQYFALAAGVVTLIAFLGYFYGVAMLYQIAPYATIALHTVIGFCVLGMGILFSRPDRGLMAVFTSENAGSLMAQRMLPALVVLPLLAGWLREYGERSGYWNSGFGAALFDTMLIVIFTTLVVWAARALNRIDAERRQNADTLLESEQKEHSRRVELEALMEAAPAVVWIAHDPQCRVITGNRAGQDILRSAPGQNLSKTAPESERPSNFEVFREGKRLAPDELSMQMAGRTGKPMLGHEIELRFSDGTSKWIYGNAVPLLKEDGTVRGVVATFVDITALKSAEQALKVSREHLRTLAHRLQAVREEERARVAREIHDVLAQELTRLKIDIAWFKRRLAEPFDASKIHQLHDKLADMSQTTDAAIQSVQKIATELRPVVLDTLGLAAAIEWQAKDFEARTGIRCNVVLPSTDLNLPRDLSTALFRIVQESLTNVVRHAAATRVDVELQPGTDWVTLRVRDDGKGIQAQASSDPYAAGLVGMRERAELLGGHCQIGPCHNGGTLVEACLPLQSAKPAENVLP